MTAAVDRTKNGHRDGSPGRSVGWRLLPWGGAVAAGGCMSLAWAPYHAVPLAFVGLAALLWVIRDAGRGRRFLLGGLAGAVAFGSAFYWVYETMIEMSGFGAALGVLAVGLYAIVHGLLWAVFALFAESLRRASDAAGPVIGRRFPLWLVTVPALWALLEWFFPYLFPIYIGYGLWGALPLVQFSDLTGPEGPSYLIVFVAAALVEGGVRWRAGERRRAWRPVAVAAAALVAVSVYGVVRIAQVDGAAEVGRLRVALVQHLPILSEKRSDNPALRYRMLEKALELTEPLVERRDAVDLVVWPEGTFPYWLADMDTVADSTRGDWRTKAGKAVVDLARRLDTDLVLGSLRRVDGRTRNAAAFLPAGGGPTEIYDKMVLVAFGEHMPLSDTFPSLKRAIKGVADIQAGTRHDWYRIGGHDALVTICYEAILPDFVRAGLAEKGDFVLNLTNDIWFGRSRGLDLHLMGQALRTVENRVPLVRATTTGISAIVDATGRLQAHTEKLESVVLEDDVVLRDVTSVYRAVGDVFLWLVVAGMLLVWGVGWRRLRREAASAAELPETGAVRTGEQRRDTDDRTSRRRSGGRKRR